MDHIFSGEYASWWGAMRPDRGIKVLNWNINRGLKLGAVMDFIARQQPDLCILQEVDLNAKRTRRTDVADVLASEFRFNYVFGIEFEELSQGSRAEPAYHGQAVFARSRILDSRILRFRHQSDFWRPRWYLPRLSAFQPRIGGRMALVVEIPAGWGKLVIYDVHLESQAEEALRLEQLIEIVRDSQRYPADTPVMLAGDLNTHTSPSALQRYLLTAGFRDACESCRRRATKPSGQMLDWIFTRGPVACSGTVIHQDVRASDHFPVLTNLTVAV